MVRWMNSYLLPSMDIMLEPSLALLAILVPLGLAYGCIVLQDKRESDALHQDQSREKETDLGKLEP